MSINFTFFFRLKNMLIQRKCHTHTKKQYMKRIHCTCNRAKSRNIPVSVITFYSTLVSSLTHSVRFTYTHHRSLQSIQTEKSHDTPTQPDRQCTFTKLDFCATRGGLARQWTCAERQKGPSLGHIPVRDNVRGLININFTVESVFACPRPGNVIEGAIWRAMLDGCPIFRNRFVISCRIS